MFHRPLIVSLFLHLYLDCLQCHRIKVYAGNSVVVVSQTEWITSNPTTGMNLELEVNFMTIVPLRRHWIRFEPGVVDEATLTVHEDYDNEEETIRIGMEETFRTIVKPTSGSSYNINSMGSATETFSFGNDVALSSDYSDMFIDYSFATSRPYSPIRLPLIYDHITIWGITISPSLEDSSTARLEDSFEMEGSLIQVDQRTTRTVSHVTQDLEEKRSPQECFGSEEIFSSDFSDRFSGSYSLFASPAYSPTRRLPSIYKNITILGITITPSLEDSSTARLEDSFEMEGSLIQVDQRTTRTVSHVTIDLESEQSPQECTTPPLTLLATPPLMQQAEQSPHECSTPSLPLLNTPPLRQHVEQSPEFTTPSLPLLDTPPLRQHAEQSPEEFTTPSLPLLDTPMLRQQEILQIAEFIRGLFGMILYLQSRVDSRS